MLDEAQDANGCVRDVILSQRCPRIFVGDQNQAIYGFLGAVNAMEDASVPATRSVALTRSFRFGSNIASVANLALEWLRFGKDGRSLENTRSFVVGGGAAEGEVIVPRRGFTNAQPEIHEAYREMWAHLSEVVAARARAKGHAKENVKSSTCVICRTNTYMWQTVFHMITTVDCKVGFVGMVYVMVLCSCVKGVKCISFGRLKHAVRSLKMKCCGYGYNMVYGNTMRIRGTNMTE